MPSPDAKPFSYFGQALRASAESSSSWKDESHGLQSLKHVVGKDGEEDEVSAF